MSFIRKQFTVIVFILSSIICFTVSSDNLHAQVMNEDSVSVASNDSTKQNPANQTPYVSRRSVPAHLLATPSYLLRAATRPLGWIMNEIEWNYQYILIEGFEVFVFPTIQTGGATSSAFGLTGFHKDIFNTGHRIDFSGSYGSRDFFSASFTYTIPDFLSEKNELELFVNNRSNPFERFFLNDIEEKDDAGRRFWDLQFNTGAVLEWHHLDWFSSRYTLSYKRVNMRTIEADNTLTPGDVEGLGVSKYFKPFAEFTVNKTDGDFRLDRGYHLTFSGGYGIQIDGDDFDFFNYSTEAIKFIPLNRGRRLVLKSVIDRTESTKAGTVPFFELPNLGADDRLRGFPSRRFVDRGILVFSAEYRYPIWEEFDMVFFIDEGQAFDEFGEIGVNRFKTSAGFGIHIVQAKNILSRFEVAFSSEETRIMISLSPGI